MERIMSEQSPKTPGARRLLLALTIVLLVAGAIAANGIISRAHSKQELVKWTDAQAAPTVALAVLSHGGAEQSLILPGNIQPYYKAAIYARVSGYLQSWQQDIGAHVKAGQVLASIDAPDVDQQFAQAKATLVSAQANAQLAAVTAQRWALLLKTQTVSQQAVDNYTSDAASKKATADAAQANVRQLEAMETFKTIVAPFDGVVTQRNTDVGALINAGKSTGQELFEVSDLHRVRIYVQVPQAFTAQLRPGLKATFEMPQYPGRKFDATLVTTSNAIDAASRSMQVELQADNADGALVGGTYCQVDFQMPSNPDTLRIPATALLPTDRGAQVAVLGDGNKVVLKAIQLGRDFGDSVEVTAGLAPADRVIDSPPETLQTGDTVNLAAATPVSSSATAAVPTPPPTVN
jgi:RND family efflux transporter MFP subunit